MLRRHRQLRTQFSQLKDTALFAVALWLAYAVRSLWDVDVFWNQQRALFSIRLGGFQPQPFDRAVRELSMAVSYPDSRCPPHSGMAGILQ